jgi:hypothetical protein
MCKKLTQREANKRVLIKCKEKNYTLLEPFIYKNNKTEIHLKCNKDGYDWTSSFSNFVSQNKGCSNCYGNVPPTQEEAEENVLSKCKEKNYTLLEPFIYKNNKTEIHLKCNKDDYEWFVSYTCFINRKGGCSKCAGVSSPTQEEALENVLSKCKEKDYTLLEEFVYKNHKTEIYLKCNKDDYDWTVTYECFMRNNNGCPKCSGHYRPTQEEAEEIVNKRCIKDNYTLLECFIYSGCDTKLSIRCNKDDYTWNVSYNKFANFYSSCPKCSGKASPSQHEAEENVLSKCKEKNYTLLESFIYKNKKTKIYLKCNKDVNTFYVSYENLMNIHNNCSVCVKVNRRQTNEEKKNWNLKNSIPAFKKYKHQVNKFTNRNKEELFLNWNGLDYYDGEYINNNLKLHNSNPSYPTIDHKISIFYGFQNNISPEEMGKIDNLVITKRCINSKKGSKLFYI